MEKHGLSKLHLAGNVNTKVKYCQHVDCWEHFRKLQEELMIILTLTGYCYFPLDIYHVIIFLFWFVFIFFIHFHSTLQVWSPDHIPIFCSVSGTDRKQTSKPRTDGIITVQSQSSRALSRSRESYGHTNAALNQFRASGSRSMYPVVQDLGTIKTAYLTAWTSSVQCILIPPITTQI